MKAHWFSRLFQSFRPFNAFLPHLRRQRKAVVTAVTVEHLEERQMLTAISWISPTDGFWDDGANWSTGQVPGFGDDVTIDVAGSPVITVRDSQRANNLISRESLVVTAAGALRVDGPGQIEDSTLTVAGSLTTIGQFTIAISAQLEWTGGGMFASSMTNMGTITISAPGNVSLGGTLNNDGSITHSGAGNLLFDGSTRLLNNAGALYDFTGDADIGRSGQGAGFGPFFQNNGTLRKSAGLGTSTISEIEFRGSATGEYDADSGRLNVGSLAELTGGTFVGSAGGVFEFSGQTDLTGSVTGTGNGRLESTGFFRSVDASTTINFPAGYFHVLGGVLGGANPLTNLGTIEVSGATNIRFGSQITNNGSIVHSGSGSVLFDGSTRLTNSATGTYNFTGDGDIARSNQGAGFNPLIDNSGTITKTGGADTSRISEIAFNNLAGGILDSDSGRLQIVSNGDWVGATLNADGTGIVEIGGSVNTTGNLDGGGTGHVELTGSVHGNVSLDFSENYFQWISGSLSGPGSGLSIVDSIEIAGAADKTAFGRVLIVGLAEHTGTGRVLINTNSTLVVQDSGVYDFQGDGGWGRSTSGGGFNPFAEIHGTLRKSAGTGTALLDGEQFGIDINVDDAVIDVQTGRLRLDDDGEWKNGAAITVAAGAVLEFSGEHTIDMMGTFTGTGAGRVEVNIAALRSVTTGVQGAHGTLDFEPGLLRWLRGGIGGAGPSMVNAGTLTTEGSEGTGTFGNGLINDGTIIHAGTGTFNTSGAFFQNSAGAVFDQQGDALLNGTDQFTNAGRFVNAGTFRKSAGAGDVTFNLRLENAATGVIEVNAGRMTFSRGGDSTGGTFNVSAGSVLGFAGNDVFGWSGTFTGSGPGDIEFNSLLSGGSTPATLDFPVGMFHMIGGQLLGGIVNEGWFDFAPAAGLFARAGITNNDTWVHSGAGDFVLNANSAFVNNGLYDLQTDADLVVPGDASGGAMRFTNNGVLQKSGGLGTSAFRHDGSNKELRFDNPGTVEVQVGTLSFNDTVVQASGNTLLGGTWIVDEFSTLTMPGSSNFTINQATVTLDGQAANFTNLAALTTNQGSLTITDGGNFPTTAAFTNSGQLTVGPGSLLTVNGNYTQSAFDQLVSWWRGEGNATDTGGANQNGTLNGNATFTSGEFGQAFSFDGTGDFISLPGSTTLNNFSISAWIRRDNLSKAGAIVSGFNGYVFGTLADGRLFLEASSSPQLTSGPLTITDDEFHHVAVTRNGGQVTFYVDGVAQQASGFTPFGGFSPFRIGGVINDANRDFQGGIDELAIFNRPLSSSDIQKLRTSNDVDGVGSIIPVLNVGIADRPASSDFGRINITGAANLSGRLNINLEGGFGPILNDQYTILNYTSRNGAFNQIGGLSPFFDITIGNSTTVLTVTTSAADIAVQNIDVPANAEPGGPVSIQYTVQNLDNIALAGSWTDSIYLSLDGVFDPSDLLVGRVTHTGGLAPQGTYSETLNAFLPGVVDGNYRVIVIADSRGDVGDTNRENNRMSSASQINVDLPTLAFDNLTPLTIDNGEDIYLKLDVPSSGDVVITADFTNSLQAEFFVRRGALPTRSEFDFVASDLTDLNRIISLASPQAGPYYILFHGREGATGGVGLTVLAENIEFDLQAVTPSRGSNQGQATTILTGAGFTEETVVELLNDLGNVVATATTRVISANRIYATFNLAGVAAGSYDVRASRPGFSDTVSDAYQVVVGVQGDLRAEILIPGSVRGGRIYTGYIDYTNIGDTDIVPPLIFVIASSPMTFDLDEQPSVLEHRFLAISPEGPAGILAPGQKVRVPFRFFGNNMTVEVLTMSPDETAPMDWEALRADIKPDDAPPEWDAVFTEVFVGAGSTVGDYVRLLAEAANLYQLREGDTTSDHNRLHGLLMAEGIEDRRTKIRGYVFRDDLNRPAGGVFVNAVNRATGAVFGAFTTEDGLLRIRDATPGTYDLIFQDVIPPANLTPIVVPVSGLPPDQEWLIQSGGGISGRVGVPVGVVLRDDFQGIQQTLVAVDEDGNEFLAGVNENGTFEFRGLPAGTYDVTFSTATTLPVTISGVVVVDGRVTDSIDLFSALGATISGIVRDADTNQPLADVTVSITSDPDNPRFAVTGADGRYAITGVSPGSVTVAITSPHLLAAPVTNVATTSGGTATVNFTADSNALGTVSGTVTLNGVPLVGAVIELKQNGTVVAGTTTGANGAYTLENLLPGVYDLSADQFNASLSVQQITVTANQELDADFDLTEGSRIHGTLTHAGGGQPTAAPGIRLTVLGPTGNLVPVLTGEDGSFEVTHLGIGSYTLMLADGSHRQDFDITADGQDLNLSFNLSTGLLVGRLFRHDGTTPANGAVVGLMADGQLVTTGRTLETGYFALPYLTTGIYSLVFDGEEFYSPINNIVVTAGTFTDVGDIIPQTASLQLTLTTTGGIPIDADGIVFISAENDPLADAVSERHTAPGAQTFTGLTPGRYLIQAGLEGYSFIQTVVDIQSGVNSISLMMDTGTIVGGTVTDGTDPVEGLSVFAYLPANPNIRWSGTTDEDGNYLLSVPAGTYTLVVADLRTGDGVTHLAEATFTNVVAGNGVTLDIDAQLVPGSANLSGTINGNPGNPEDPPLGAVVTLTLLDGTPVAITEADEFGAYEFVGVGTGSYKVIVNAAGYSFNELNVNVAAGSNTGANPSGVWLIPATSGVIEAEPDPFAAMSFAGQSSDVGNFDDAFASMLGDDAAMMAMFGDISALVTSDPENAQSLVGSAKERLMDIWDLLFREPVEDPTRHGGAGQIPDSCPEALTAFQRVLRYQLLADQFFRNWHERWETGRKTFAINAGLFAISVAKFASSLYFAKNVIVYSGQLNTLLNSQKGVKDGFNKVFAAYQNGSDLNAVGAAAGIFKECETILRPAILNAQRLFELRSISGPALASLPGSAVSSYLGVKTSPTIVEVLTELERVGSWSSLADVAQSVNVFTGFGGAIVQLLDSFGAVLNLARPNPAFAPLIAILSPLSDGLSVISSAAQGIKDLLADSEAVSQFKFAYENAIAQRNAAFEAFLDILQHCDLDDEDDADEPDHPLTREDLRQMFLVQSSDPNDIVGPAGGGPAHAMRVDQNFPYTILYENKPEATAPAQEVVITTQLDSDLDWSTFELGAFGFGDVIVEVPAGRNFYETRVDLSSTLGIFVDFSAGINLQTGVVTWRLTSIDPATGDLVADALAGYLPPNNASHDGEGFVNYSVSPKSNLTTGAVISAQASIVFDTNDPLLTPTYTNLIDTGAPTSTVNPLAATQNFPSFLVSWTGTDDAVGPTGGGVATYDVYVSDNGGPFTSFLLGTTQTSATFTGQVNHTYSFYSVATDFVGFEQPTPQAAQTSTQVLDVLFDFGDAPDPLSGVAGNYPTLLSNNGPRHLMGSGLFLGATVDREFDGQPNSTAAGDDTTGAPDDEDGVVLPGLIRGANSNVTVTASQAGKLDAWIDFNRDGDWNDAGEQIATNLAVTAGSNNVTFAVPALASIGATYARFRLSSAGGLGVTGEAADGEVEDYQVQISNPFINVNGQAVEWVKKAPPVNVLPIATVNATGLTGGTLTISVNAVGTKKKVLDLFNFGSFSAIGNSTSGPQFANGQLTLQIQLNGNATASTVQAFLRGITFSTKGKGLKSATRTLSVTLAKSDGSSSTATQTINVRKK